MLWIQKRPRRPALPYASLLLLGFRVYRYQSTRQSTVELSRQQFLARRVGTDKTSEYPAQASLPHSLSRRIHRRSTADSQSPLLYCRSIGPESLPRKHLFEPVNQRPIIR